MKIDRTIFSVLIGVEDLTEEMGHPISTVTENGLIRMLAFNEILNDLYRKSVKKMNSI